MPIVQYPVPTSPIQAQPHFLIDQFGNPLIANADGITVQTLTAQGTGTVNSNVQTNINARGVMVVVNITAITAGSLTVTIQAVDPVSGATLNLLASTAIATAIKTVLVVYPGITAAANVSASAVLTRSWQVSSVVATGPVTAVISASYVI